MIVHDPYWMERESPTRKSADSLWVNLDRPNAVPFGFGIHAEPKEKKKRKKAKK